MKLKKEGLVLLLVFLFVFINASLVNAASFNCSYDGIGHWNIGTAIICDDEDILIDEDFNVNIYSEGNLTLINTKLKMNSSYSGASEIDVNGGKMHITSGSNTTSATAFNFIFEVDSGSKFSMTDSYLRNKTKADKELIEKRMDARVVWLHDNKIEWFEGEKAIEIGKRLIEKQKTQEDIAKGTIAFPGIVKGKVTIIHTVKDHDKFQEGDILISHDVSTESTAVLKKASAIVTDQGGIISHAAIVAREFKTPCIVGTGNASKIFKDGDLVEVDANNGTVKILK